MTKEPQKSIVERETEILNFWQQAKVFEKSVTQRAATNSYVFYDGPPFISGYPHYGHLLVSTAKDLIPRYWAMQGKRVERVWGWDAHGLTVENRVQKELKIKNRRDIVSFGLEEFTKACYIYTSKISSEWQWYIDRIGRWVDMPNAYRTTDKSYMESVMWAFKQLYDKKLIYEGVRTSLYCPTCGTPVSNFEVAMDNTYREEKDPSITIKFKLTSSGEFFGVSMLAWTTTPWTLPSNRALVVNATEPYALVTYQGQSYLCAEKRLKQVFKTKDYTLVKSVFGRDLVGLHYAPLYSFYKGNEQDFMVYEFGDMANGHEGTGIVHSAPGFGDIDTQMGKKFNLTLMQTLSDEAKFIPGNDQPNPWAGMFYLSANQAILAELASRDLVFESTTVTHRVPFHDRCDTLLLQRAQKAWFVDVTGLKPKLYEENKAITWVPARVKTGRFKKGIEQAPDWTISRARFWATPIPVWRAADGDTLVVGSIKDLEELSGQKVEDLHRPYIDNLVITKNQKTYHRVEEVLDSWFEAASMPFAQFHYPFENSTKFEANFPGDFIVEYEPQTRAWFFVMHVLSNGIFGSKSFKNAIAHGTIAGNDGRKMSKTYGNYTDPKEVLTTYGGDALRLFFMSSVLMLGGRTNFSEKELKSKVASVLNPFWNSLVFFKTYAKQHSWDETKCLQEPSKNVLDSWLLIRLAETNKQVQTNLEKYLIPPAVWAIEHFIDDLSRWYVRRSRSRFSEADPQAFSTLFLVLKELALLSAPVIPFISESVYLALKEFARSAWPESVHLCDYPSYQKINRAKATDILAKMTLTRTLVSAVLGLRTQAGLKVRQPLATLYLVPTAQAANAEYYQDILLDEVNVKKLEVTQPGSELLQTTSDGFTLYLDVKLTPELLIEGEAREFVRAVQDLRKEAGLVLSQKIKVYYPTSSLSADALKAFETEIKAKLSATDLVVADKLAVEIL